MNDSPSPSTSVAAVIVTRNRPELLRSCLTALSDQIRRPEAIYVFDNASDPPVSMAPPEDLDCTTIRSTVNVGGAGGFHELIRRAHADGHGWIWLMDDDSEPTPTALAELLLARDAYEPNSIDLVASKVTWTDGRVHPMNLVGPKFGCDRGFYYDAAEKGHISIRTASFVSILVHRRAVDRVGLPCKEYFIWNDDIEYTARILRHARGICAPKSVVIHRTGIPNGTLDAPPERFRYHIRNQLWMLKKSPAFSRKEKLKILVIYLAVIAVWCGKAPLVRIPLATSSVIKALCT